MMNELIQKLEKERAHHEYEMGKRSDAIKALQACCEHEWKHDGHDSHYDYRRCTICGLSECCR